MKLFTLEGKARLDLDQTWEFRAHQKYGTERWRLLDDRKFSCRYRNPSAGAWEMRRRVALQLLRGIYKMSTSVRFVVRFLGMFSTFLSLGATL